MDFLKKVKVALFIIIVLSLFSGNPSFGQAFRKFRISLESGIDRVYYRNYLGANHWSIGSTSGINCELMVSEHLSFLTGLAYANRNINAGVVWISGPGNSINENLFSERHLKVLEFSPVTFRYRFSNKAKPVKINPFFQMGLITSFSITDRRIIITDVETSVRNYAGIKPYKQGVEFGGGAEYILNERITVLLFLTSRLTRLQADSFRFVPESNFDKICARIGVNYRL